MTDRASTQAAPAADSPHRTRAKVCELIAQLAWGPKPASELIEATGMARGTAYTWIGALRRAGVIYVHELRGSNGRDARVWALQPRPFERQDARRPAA